MLPRLPRFCAHPYYHILQHTLKIKKWSAQSIMNLSANNLIVLLVTLDKEHGRIEKRSCYVLPGFYVQEFKSK